MPTVSIVIPLHNKGAYVAETLASVKAQRLGDWELIVVENGSEDGGPELVAQMAAQDSRMQLIRASEQVSGPCGARNVGILRASGQWLLFLDADDWIEPEHLQSLVTAGQAAGADVVAGGWREFIEGSRTPSVLRDGPAERAASTTVLDMCLAFAPWAVHAALIRRKWLSEIHLWPMEMERLPSEDSVFWFRILHGAILASVPTHFAVYRKETPGNRDVHRDLTVWMEGVLRVIELNELFLLDRGMLPSPIQAAHVLRSLESLWLRCRETGMGLEAGVVEREAQRWLNMSAFEPGLLLRQMIGIRGFNYLRNVLWKRKSKNF